MTDTPRRWTYDTPDDLRRHLEETLSRRGVGPAEIWGYVVDWLNAHGVEPPAADRPKE